MIIMGYLNLSVLSYFTCSMIDSEKIKENDIIIYSIIYLIHLII